MRVLGAIDMAAGKNIQARIKAVSQMTFTDEDGQPRQFTWRTIQTWFSRYQKHGVTVMENQPRSICSMEIFILIPQGRSHVGRIPICKVL